MATARYYPNSFAPSSPKPLEGRSVAYLAIGVAALSALSVFFVLCERDHSFLAQASQAEAQTSIAAQPAHIVPGVATRTEAASKALPGANSSVAAQTEVRQSKVQTTPEYIPFDVARSRRFQRIGPISMGLWRTDAKHGTYDASLLVDGHRFDKKHIGMDEALAIKIGAAAPMELIVNRVTKNDISGYLSKPRQAASH